MSTHCDHRVNQDLGAGSSVGYVGLSDYLRRRSRPRRRLRRPKYGFVPPVGKHIFQKLTPADISSDATLLLPSPLGFAATTCTPASARRSCPSTSALAQSPPPAPAPSSLRAGSRTPSLPRLRISRCSASPHGQLRSTHNATHGVRRRSILRKCKVPLGVRTS